jgi:hypothetical protein
MKRKIWLSVFIGALMLAAVLRADWTTYRGDQARTGYYTVAPSVKTVFI